jgi:hypothetical protein
MPARQHDLKLAVLRRPRSSIGSRRHDSRQKSGCGHRLNLNLNEAGVAPLIMAN